MQNPIYEEIAKKHNVNAQQVEEEMQYALSQAGNEINIPEFLLALSDALKDKK